MLDLFLTVVLVHGGHNVVHEVQHILDDLLLVAAQSAGHLGQTGIRVLLDASDHTLARANVLFVCLCVQTEPQLLTTQPCYFRAKPTAQSCDQCQISQTAVQKKRFYIPTPRCP